MMLSGVPVPPGVRCPPPPSTTGSSCARNSTSRSRGTFTTCGSAGRMHVVRALTVAPEKRLVLACVRASAVTARASSNAGRRTRRLIHQGSRGDGAPSSCGPWPCSMRFLSPSDVVCLRRSGRLWPMRQRVTVITLGVHDLASARRFYEALGWRSGAAPAGDVVFFQVGDMVLSLWDRAELAKDSCVEDTPGWGGVTLALNLGSRDEVDAATEQARAAGARIGREPGVTLWG